MKNIEKIIKARGGKKQNNLGLRLIIMTRENKHMQNQRGIHEQADCLPLTSASCSKCPRAPWL